jgi:hypothetical protein
MDLSMKMTRKRSREKTVRERERDGRERAEKGRGVSRGEDWTGAGAGAVERAKRRKGYKSKSSLFRLTLR